MPAVFFLTQKPISQKLPFGRASGKNHHLLFPPYEALLQTCGTGVLGWLSSVSHASLPPADSQDPCSWWRQRRKSTSQVFSLLEAEAQNCWATTFVLSLGHSKSHGVGKFILTFIRGTPESQGRMYRDRREKEEKHWSVHATHLSLLQGHCPRRDQCLCLDREPIRDSFSLCCVCILPLLFTLSNYGIAAFYCLCIKGIDLWWSFGK